MRHLTGRTVAGIGLALTMALTGCSGGSDDSSDDESTDAPLELPTWAPNMPDLDELSRRGFDCQEVPVSDAEYYQHETRQLCILSDSAVSASWTIRTYDDKVIAWDYFAWPADDGVPLKTVGLMQAKALQTVFDTLLPQDFKVLGPALEEWTTPKDTKTWDFDGSNHAGLTGTGIMDFEATLQKLPTAIGAGSVPLPVGPELDPAAFVDAAEAAGWNECESEDRGETQGHQVRCDVGGVFNVRLDIDTDGRLHSLNIVHFGSDDGPRLLKELTGISKNTGSEEFATWTAQLAKQARRGTTKRYTWVGGLPALITPVRHADGLMVDARLLLEIP